MALQQSLGVDVELLSPRRDAAALCPYLDTGDLLGATYSPRDGYADPYLVHDRDRRPGARAGREIRTGTR